MGEFGDDRLVLTTAADSECNLKLSPAIGLLVEGSHHVKVRPAGNTVNSETRLRQMIG